MPTGNGAGGGNAAMNAPTIVGICLPWFLVFQMAYQFVIRARWPSDAKLKNNMLYQQPLSLDVDEAGILASDGAMHVRCQWNAFDAFIETRGTFAIRFVNQRQWIVLPKRAVATPTAMDEMRGVFQNHVKSSNGAFPVIPLQKK